MASPQQSGYQCQFVDRVDDYECPLCLHVTREPFLTSCCGQHFCQVCISRILTDKKPCPFCKNTSFSTFLDKKQKRRVLDLKVYCNKKTQGCQWMGGVGELGEHLVKKCQFVVVNCSNNCGLVIQRQYLEVHRFLDCPKRRYNCEYCNLSGTYKDIQDNHLPVCPKYPVLCPNQCGVSPLERDQLEDHLRECPLQLVECELREMGCEEMVKQKDLVRHMEEGTQKHLTLMASKYLKLNERITKLERENEGLRKELSDKTKQTNDEICYLKDQLKLNMQYHTGTTKIRVNFTTLKKKRQYLEEKDRRWYNKTTFHTFPSNCEMRVNLYPRGSEFDIELTQVQSAVDENLQWPKWFTMTVKLVDLAGDHDHQVTKDVKVKKGRFNDEVRIPYAIIENPSLGVQYISDGHITIVIIVSEK